MGANCPLVFGYAIPAFGYISSLRCEDNASIGAKEVIIFLFLYFVNLNLFNLNLFQILTVIARNVAIFFFLTAKNAKIYAKFAKILTD